MKTFISSSMIVLLLLGANAVQAQTTQTKLNQIELMKNFLGNWKCVYGKDTTMILEYKSFGTAIEGVAKIVVSEKVIMEEKSLMGYDAKNDKLIEAAMYNSFPNIILYSDKFISANRFEEIYLEDSSNPEKANKKWEVEFKSTDLFIETFFQNNKAVEVYTFTRIK